MKETNQSENLIITEKPKSQNLDNPYIVVSSNFQSQSKIKISKGIFGILVFFILFLSISISPVIVLIILPSINLKDEEYRLFFLIFFIFPIFMVLFCCKRKLELIKDKDSLIILDKNYLCCWKKHKLSMKYTDIICKESGSETGCCMNHQLSSLIIYEINPNEIDLDKSNIKNKPIQFLYKFKDYIGDYNGLQLKLNNFKGFEFKNQILNEMQLYVSITNRNRYMFGEKNYKIIDQFIKLSDNFYCYFNFDFLEESSSKNNFERIDWIYSNIFDRIFIGVVKNNNTYLNTFTDNINSINKFILEMNNEKYLFKVLLKDGNSLKICEFIKEEEKGENLNNFIYFINGQINNIKIKITDNSAPTII